MEEQKLTNRQLQAEATKNKIYKVSIELLEKKGFDNLKVEDICKTAGVSIGSFYNYFTSKYDILIEIYKRADEYFENEVSINLTNTNAAEAIVEYFDYYANYNDLVGIEIMKQLYNGSNKMFAQKGRYMQALLQEVIKEGQSKGELITTMSSDEINDYLFTAARGVAYDWCIHNGEYDIKEHMHSYFSRLIVIFSQSK